MNLNKVLYPFKSNFLDINKLKMHYIDEGTGEVVLMLHGNPTWSFFYRDLIKLLSHKYRCVAPDHIGSGLSDKPSKERYSYALSDRAENIYALVKSLNINDLTLVMHDWGALVGMTYAARHPETVKRIVVLNSAAFGLPDGRPFPWMIALCKNNLLGPLLVQGMNLFSKGANIFCVKKKMSEDVKNMYLYPYDSWKNRYGVLAFILDVPLSPGHVSWNVLKETEKKLSDFNSLPVLICWAGQDFVFDKHFFERWEKDFPNAEIKIFPYSGHYILEDAGEEAGGDILSFLERHPLKH